MFVNFLYWDQISLAVLLYQYMLVFSAYTNRLLLIYNYLVTINHDFLMSHLADIMHVKLHVKYCYLTNVSTQLQTDFFFSR